MKTEDRVEAPRTLSHREILELRSEELRRSNNDLQQFAYVAAHDLREPLRMVASYVQLLAKRYQGRLDPEADEFIAYAVGGVRRMERLIDDLLTYCRAGIAERPFSAISTKEALKTALLNLQCTIEECAAVVTFDDLPNVVGDSVQLVQLFQNLIANALKYRGTDPPRVHVSAKRDDSNEWVFSVQDNGLGIEARYFEKIFVMFQRLHARDEFSGTGIGLSLCKKIVERHNGRIWVASEPGTGSTFYFTIPEKE